MTQEAAASPNAKMDSLVRINWVLLVALSIGLIAAIFQAPSSSEAGNVVVWALGSLTVGAIVGLLFGIPRMKQRDGTSAEEREDPGAQPLINNNLIEVSDWLTKIIVGVGLVELKEAPVFLKHIAGPLGRCVGGDCGLAVAVGTIVFFAAAGFLAGYINSRTVVAGMFVAWDRELLAEQVEKLARDVRKTELKQEAQEVVSDVRLQAIKSSLPEQLLGAQFAPAAGDELEGLREGLLKIAAEYESIRDPNHVTRVAAKNSVAHKLLDYILVNKISKATLYQWVQASRTDGMIMTFAAYVLADPNQGDLQKLLDLAPDAKWLHVKYRIALALRELHRLSLGDPQEWKRAYNLLTSFSGEAKRKTDAPLVNLTEEVMRSLGTPS